ncbi:hypothetical protein LTR97_008431 [Elasticomyces elasticus]|uniref:Uncharacterized protein n=1 Tax=Elasticomyces elasticus TaxID=574655 RepID=A0AAN7VYM2_9PEZI|nr:hypothetical protein LTR97_008431 [Elasticomyces elasticus]
MKSFRHDLGRRLGLFKKKRRQKRPAKSHGLHLDIEDEMTSVFTPSPLSENTVTSPDWIEEEHHEAVVAGLDPEPAQSTTRPQPRIEPGPVLKLDEYWDFPPLRSHDPIHEESISGDPADISHEPINETTESEVEEQESEVELEDGLDLFAKQQAIRDETYAEFEGEEETDYTAGPSRLVWTSDGVQADCSALLLTFELSTNIREALRAQRDYEQVKRHAKKEDAANKAFESKLRRQITRHERRIAALEKPKSDTPNVTSNDWAEQPAHGTDGESEEISTLRRELSRLQLLFDNTKAKREGITVEVDWKLQVFREQQAEVNACLEEAFTAALLLEPVGEELEIAVEDIDIDEEYERICQMQQEDAENGPLEFEPLHRCDEDLRMPTPSPEEQAKNMLKETFRFAQEELKSAKADFDDRSDARDREKAENEAAVARGETPRDATPLDFDLRWFVRNQELTRGVINAEAALAQAKKACLDGGVSVVERDQESGFADHTSDGYRESAEAAWIEDVQDSGKVDGWIADLPDTANSAAEAVRDEVELDEWDARSIGSTDNDGPHPRLADGSWRRRIDDWNKVCGLFRAARQTESAAQHLNIRTDSASDSNMMQPTPISPDLQMTPVSDGGIIHRLVKAVTGDIDLGIGRLSSVPQPSPVHEAENGIDAELKQPMEPSPGNHDDQPATQASPGPMGVTEEIADLVKQGEEDTRVDLQDPTAESEEECEAIDEETARQGAYVSFLKEEPDDYTFGPPRFVLAVDGVKQCAALLMTMDLSSKVQRAVNAQRDYAVAKDIATEQEWAKFRCERELDDALTRHEDRIAELRKMDTEAAAAELVALEGEAEKLQLLLTETQAAQMSLKAGLNTQADNLRRIQTELSQSLEEAFIHAKLMEPAAEQAIQEVPELQVEEEYQKLCKAIREDQGMEPTSAPPSPQSCYEYMTELSPEDQEREDLIDAYYAADDHLRVLQQEFDNKDEKLAIARDLINAEEAFAAAKAAVLEAGLNIANDDAESGFGNVGFNGYAEEFEARMVATTNVPHVEGWLGNVADEASPEVDIEADVKVDDWDARNVEIWDSSSCVAYEPAWRRRIKKWRQHCGL